MISNLVTIGPGNTSSTVASIPKSLSFNSSNLDKASRDSSEFPYFSLLASSRRSKLGINDAEDSSNNLVCLSFEAFLPSSIGGITFSIFGFELSTLFSFTGVSLTFFSTLSVSAFLTFLSAALSFIDKISDLRFR